MTKVNDLDPKRRWTRTSRIALFTSLHWPIQDFIDRHFYRRKYDAVLALESFAASACKETDVKRLTVELVRVVQETLQPLQASMCLKNPHVEADWSSDEQTFINGGSTS